MTADAPTAAQPEMRLFARAWGVITAPGATMAQVVASPRPVGILFICAVVIGLAAGLPQFTESGRQAVLTQQVETTERFLGRPVTAEEYTVMDRRSHYGAYSTLVGVLIAFPIFALLWTALYWVAFNTVLGGTGSFKQVLAINSHSYVPAALGAVIGAPIQLMQDKVTQGGPFNLGVLAPMLDPASPLATLLGWTNVFTIWGFVITAIGLAALYRRKALNIFIGLIVAHGILLYGILSVVGSMFGGGQTGR
jgi:hypothetical protein